MRNKICIGLLFMLLCAAGGCAQLNQMAQDLLSAGNRKEAVAIKNTETICPFYGVVYYPNSQEEVFFFVDRMANLLAEIWVKNPQGFTRYVYEKGVLKSIHDNQDNRLELSFGADAKVKVAIYKGTRCLDTLSLKYNPQIAPTTPGPSMPGLDNSDRAFGQNLRAAADSLQKWLTSIEQSYELKQAQIKYFAKDMGLDKVDWLLAKSKEAFERRRVIIVEAAINECDLRPDTPADSANNETIRNEKIRPYYHPHAEEISQADTSQTGTSFSDSIYENQVPANMYGAWSIDLVRVSNRNLITNQAKPTYQIALLVVDGKNQSAALYNQNGDRVPMWFGVHKQRPDILLMRTHISDCINQFASKSNDTSLYYQPLAEDGTALTAPSGYAPVRITFDGLKLVRRVQDLGASDSRDINLTSARSEEVASYRELLRFPLEDRLIRFRATLLGQKNNIVPLDYRYQCTGDKEITFSRRHKPAETSSFGLLFHIDKNGKSAVNGGWYEIRVDSVVLFYKDFPKRDLHKAFPASSNNRASAQPAAPPAANNAWNIEGTYKLSVANEGFIGTVVVTKSGDNFKIKIRTKVAERFECSFDGASTAGAAARRQLAAGDKSVLLKFHGDGFTVPIKFESAGLTIVGEEVGGPLDDLRRTWCGMNAYFNSNVLYKRTGR